MNLIKKKLALPQICRLEKKVEILERKTAVDFNPRLISRDHFSNFSQNFIIYDLRKQKQSLKT